MKKQTENKTSKSIIAFDKAVEKLIVEFEKKHEYDFSYWVGDDPTGIACFIEQYFFNLSDIYIDILDNAPVGEIFKWQDYCLEHQDKKINFASWLMNIGHYKRHKK